MFQIENSDTIIIVGKIVVIIIELNFFFVSAMIMIC